MFMLVWMAWKFTLRKIGKSDRWFWETIRLLIFDKELVKRQLAHPS